MSIYVLCQFNSMHLESMFSTICEIACNPVICCPVQVAVFYFHDDFTWMKGLGLGTIMFGVSLFNWYK